MELQTSTRLRLFLSCAQAFSSKRSSRLASGLADGHDECASLRGKTFIVTGGNSGIGKGVAIRLAVKGAEVHIICRREDAAREAVEEIKAAAAKAAGEAREPPPRVEYHMLDMSSVKAVHSFAEEWTRAKRPLDGLCNNAGKSGATRCHAAWGTFLFLSLSSLLFSSLFWRLAESNVRITESPRITETENIKHEHTRFPELRNPL